MGAKSTGRFNGTKGPSHLLPMFTTWEYSPKTKTKPIYVFIARDMQTSEKKEGK